MYSDILINNILSDVIDLCGELDLARSPRTGLTVSCQKHTATQFACPLPTFGADNVHVPFAFLTKTHAR